MSHEHKSALHAPVLPILRLLLKRFYACALCSVCLQYVLQFAFYNVFIRCIVAKDHVFDFGGTTSK